MQVFIRKNHYLQKCAIGNGDDEYFISEEKSNPSISTIMKIFINHIETGNF